MRVLITGGTGFLGSYILPMLEEHEVFAITRGNHESMKASGSVTWIKADLSQGIDTSILPSEMDAVIHLAQSDHYRSFPDGASDMFKVNVEVPAKLLQWAQAAGVKSFVSASTGTVYEPFTGEMKEDCFISPTGYYGASKLAAEALALAYSKEFSICQLRVFFLYGPGQENMMIANIINNIKNEKTITLPEDNTGLEFVPTYVDDTARVFVKAMEEKWEGVYNVASPHVVDFETLITEIGNAVGKEPIIERVKAEKPTPIVPNLEKIGEMVDLNTFVTLKNGLAKTVTE